MIRETGVPRNSPLDPSLDPNDHHHDIPHHHHNGRSALPGMPNGILDLGDIERVRGTYSKHMGAFVSTAIPGGVSQARHGGAIDSAAAAADGYYYDNAGIKRRVRPNSGGKNNNSNKKSGSPSSSASQQRLERSSPNRDRVNVHNDSDIQMRFTASVMPPGRRHIQPLPDFLDTGYGFRATLASPPPSQQATSATNQQDFLSTSTPLHYNTANHQQQDNGHDEHQHDVSVGASSIAQQQHSVNTSRRSSQHQHQHQHQHRNAGGGPSPVPHTPQQLNRMQQQHQQLPSSLINNHNNKPRSSSRGGNNNNPSERLYSQHTVRDSLHELVTSKSPRRIGGSTSSRRRPNSVGPLSSSRGIGGRASRVTCCPEDMARGGHLAQGIVIGSCERQAMERYLQVSRELELEQEARATDKWKHELELVKLLNRKDELEAQVEKLTEIAENPKPLRDAQLLRTEYENRWRGAQKLNEDLEQEKIAWQAEKEELQLAVLKKDHEIEGLRAAVKRMEATDNNHEDDLATVRRKWFKEKKAREEAEARSVELEKRIAELERTVKSFRSTVRGLEQQLVVKYRRDKMMNGNSGNNSNSGRGGVSPRPMSETPPLAAGAARNASLLLRSPSSSLSGSGGAVQAQDIDAAVKTLMGLYSSPTNSPSRAGMASARRMLGARDGRSLSSTPMRSPRA